MKKGAGWRGRYALAGHGLKHLLCGGLGCLVPRALSPSSSQQLVGQLGGFRVPLVVVVCVGREMLRLHFFAAAGTLYRRHGTFTCGILAVHASPAVTPHLTGCDRCFKKKSSSGSSFSYTSTAAGTRDQLPVAPATLLRRSSCARPGTSAPAVVPGTSAQRRRRSLLGGSTTIGATVYGTYCMEYNE